MEEQQRNEELEAEEEEELNKRQEQNQEDADSFLKFDFLSVLSKPKVFYFFSFQGAFVLYVFIDWMCSQWVDFMFSIYFAEFLQDIGGGL